jgi:hypothetical protein
MLSQKSPMRSKSFWLDFAVFCLPFALLIFYFFVITNKQYFDKTAEITFHYWVAMGMGWGLGDWPLLLYNAGGGFREHHPAIPQEQIVGLVWSFFGGKEANFATWSALGIVINICVIAVCALWTAFINSHVGAHRFILFCIAALVATQPTLTLFWAPYTHVLAIMIPLGLALFAIIEDRKTDAKSITIFFYVLGFSLGVLYSSGLVILAMIAAMTIYMIAGNDRLYWKLCDVSLSKTKLAVSLVFMLIMFFGFALHAFNLLASAATFIRNAGVPKNLIILGAGGAFIAAFVAVAWFVRVYGDRHFMRFFSATAGRGLIGWAIGANVFMLSSWQLGILAARDMRKSAPKNMDNIWETPLSVLPGHPWIFAIIILAVVAVSMLVIWLCRGANRRPEDLFFGLFIIVLLAANTIIALPLDLGFASGDSFAGLRHMVPATAAIPVVFVWAWRRHRLSGIALGLVSLLICGFSIANYQKHMAPFSKVESAVSQFLKTEVSRFHKKYPDGNIICLNDPMADLCAWEWTLDYYRIRHELNIKNPPLPPQFHKKSKRYVLASQACGDVYECLNTPINQQNPILIISRDDIVPAAVAERKMDWSTDGTAPGGVWISLFFP